MKYKILFIEDSKDMQFAVSQVLKKEFNISLANTVKQACERLAEKKFDLVLLDLTLSDGDGFKICKHIRETESLKKTPIIFLTGRTSFQDKDTAFTLGADDYVVKPTGSRELRSRILSRLERAKEKKKEPYYYIGNLKLDIPGEKISVTGGKDEVLVDLSHTEFKILHHFAQNIGHVFSKNQLFADIWKENIYLLERSIDDYISILARKLEDVHSNCTITSVSDSSYKFCLNDKK